MTGGKCAWYAHLLLEDGKNEPMARHFPYADVQKLVLNPAVEVCSIPQPCQFFVNEMLLVLPTHVKS